MAKEDTPSKALISSGDGPRYTVGDSVRVRAGVLDPDFPDIPLAGWAGEVADIDETSPPLYLIRWSAETLSKVTPAYTVRCEREVMDGDETWLLGKDLEADAGGQLAIVPPQKLSPRPLESDDSEDRVRAIFGLTGDDPLPKIDQASLRRFHEYFTKNLNLPQPAQFDDAPGHELLVLRCLLPLEDDAEEEGIVVEVLHEDRIETVPLYEVSLLADYDIGDDVLAYGEWFVDSRPGDATPTQFPNFSTRLPSLEMLLGRVLLAFLLIGALFGAILWADDSAVAMAEGGGLLCGVIGIIFGARSEALLRRTLLRPPGFLIGLLLGATLGTVFGAVFAVLLLGFVGVIAGAILGNIVGQLLSACGVRNHGTFRLTFLGSYLGAGTYIFLHDTEKAITGSIYGFLGGGGAFLLTYAVMNWGMSRLPRPRL